LASVSVETELSYDHPVNDVIANNVVDGGGVGVGVYFGGIIENLRFRNNIFTSGRASSSGRRWIYRSWIES